MLAMWDGSIRPVVDSVFGLDDVVDAARKVNSGDQFGKVVLALS
jgi:NADPH:quinone reductase-like Zn-dependent oxidoreductase